MSVIPDECEISVDRRYMPDETIESLINEEFEESIQTVLKKKDSRFQMHLFLQGISMRQPIQVYSKNIMKYHPALDDGEG